MTQQQLHDEAREIYRTTYTALLPSCLHENAQKIAKEQYDQYIMLFQSHVTQPEPVRNAYKLPEFVPDWDSLIYDFCVQDPNGSVWNCEIKPIYYHTSKEWIPSKGQISGLGDFAPPADWKSAIWERPKPE